MSTKVDSKPVTTRDGGAWAPFQSLPFAMLWTATVVSNVGTWMHDVGAGWLMTTLSPSPVMVSLVQAATTLPVFLFALVAGAVADIVDRRRLLLIVNLLMGVVAGLFAVVVASGQATVELLLLFTFLLGTGAAFVAPAWQAIVPSLVPKKDLSSAVALNSMGINISRAIGPALAGVLITAVGLASPFALNALSFVGILAALVFWKPEHKTEKKLPPEPVFSAIQTGVRYALHSPALKSTLLRAIAFFLFASAYWAMLPLIAKDLLSGGPGLYGMLLGCVGGGAVLGALLLPKIRKRLGADNTVAAGTIGTALVLAVFALVPSAFAAYAISLLAGFSWIAVLSSLNVSAQASLPEWVRARGLSIYLTVFFGSMSLGSVIWGQVASFAGIPTALLAAAIFLLVMLALVRRVPLTSVGSLDLTPSAHWPAPIVSDELAADRGPVMILIDYQVKAQDTDAFLKAVRRFSAQRRRDGAVDWNIFQDAEDAEHWTESFVVSSWLDHMRQHDRVTRTDADLQEDLRKFHQGPDAPRVRHLLTPSH
ncbi:MFS transporter [Roseibium sp.]|uniref:MFS transporter n=1 Tax=Roseibium sp. TaxID=1936156 RepID=UPI003B50EA91